MPLEDIRVYTVQEAVHRIIPYLEGTAHKAVYFEGWNGLAASAVLRAIAERPPPSLTNKFDKIIHIDCSRWKSRRELQRAIADELKLPGHVVAHFDRQDEEDDFSGVEQASRAEIADVTREIYQTLKDLSYMVIFHNGSDNTVDMGNFGIFQFDWFPCTVLWTFRGRFRLNKEIQEKVDYNSLLFVDASKSYTNYNELIEEEAREITLYANKHGLGITPEVARDCCVYLLSLNHHGGNIMDYSWETHASNYWVCDGIVGGDMDSQAAWDVARALHQEVRLEDYSSNRLPVIHYRYDFDTSPTRWILLVSSSDIEEKVHPETTSLFLAPQREPDQPLASIPTDMFQQADQLRVLKLCGCTFNFSSPPFHCCYNLRFLGLDSCMDQENLAEEEKKGAHAMEIFQRLWVLDVCQTDWELAFPEEIQEQVATNIREVHIRKGRIWHSSFEWRRLQNLGKIRVIEPTSSWETGKKDEFTDLEKLELLDLSGNTTIQVLPSLSSASCLRTLVLDGCIGLDHVGPEGLPPALETFSLDAISNKLSKICLSGCAHLKSFLLRGELPGLEELNLSGTSIKRIDLSDKVVQVKGLKKVFLMGCKQLRAILWWAGRQLEVLCIDTLETEYTCHRYSVSDPSRNQHRNYVVTGDARMIQSLLTHEYGAMISSSLYLDLHVPHTSSSSKSKGPSKDKVIPKPFCYTYSDVSQQGVSSYDSEMKWPPPLDPHMEIGEGICLTDVESNKGIKAIYYVTLKCIYSLHVHDNSGIFAVTPKYPPDRSYAIFVLRWCRVERCPKLVTVFASGINYEFSSLETIWASDLPAATCIWSKGSIYDVSGSFEALESIHLHKCPRLKFALPLSRYTYLPRLETLHITQCGDLKQVFPWNDVIMPQQHSGADRTMKEFPKLKHILLKDLFNLQEICEAKMAAPVLESVRIRGCWGLRRLPMIGGHQNNHRRPVVHCQEDWWTKLEWDGLHAGHDPSLYEPRYLSAYYKKRLLRGTVLRYMSKLSCVMSAFSSTASCCCCNMDHQGFAASTVGVPCLQECFSLKNKLVARRCMHPPKLVMFKT